MDTKRDNSPLPPAGGPVRTKPDRDLMQWPHSRSVNRMPRAGPSTCSRSSEPQVSPPLPRSQAVGGQPNPPAAATAVKPHSPCPPPSGVRTPGAAAPPSHTCPPGRWPGDLHSAFCPCGCRQQGPTGSPGSTKTSRLTRPTLQSPGALAERKPPKEGRDEHDNPRQGACLLEQKVKIGSRLT